MKAKVHMHKKIKPQSSKQSKLKVKNKLSQKKVRLALKTDIKKKSESKERDTCPTKDSSICSHYEDELRKELCAKYFPNQQNLLHAYSNSSNDAENKMDDSVSVTTVPIKNKNLEESTVKLSKSQKQRRRKREVKLLKKAAKAAIPKPEPKEPPVSSFIEIPKSNTSKLDTDEKRLEAACNRLAEVNIHTLCIRPVPKRCSSALIKDLCPLAVSIRIPSKLNSRFIVAQFRSRDELEATRQFLSTQILDGKPIKVQTNENTYSKDQFKRTLSDFCWTRLRVSNLPRGTTRFDLAQVFTKAISIQFPTYDDGSCKGHCYLKYRRSDLALQAFETRHGTFIRGNPIYVNFSLKRKSNPMKSKISSTEMNRLETNVNIEPANKIKCDNSSNKSIINNQKETSTEFMIQSSLSLNESELNKRQNNEMKKEIEPKLMCKHQLKDKGKKKSNSKSALDNLLHPLINQKTKTFKSKNRKKSSKR